MVWDGGIYVETEVDDDDSDEDFEVHEVDKEEYGSEEDSDCLL